MNSTSNDIIGKLIFGRYRIESKIGEGGRGEVYQAFDLQLYDKVAVKRLLANVAEDAQAIKRFEKEPRITRRLRGPYVIFVEAFNRDTILDEYFSVMEFVPGGALSKLLDTTERMPISEALRLALEICEALDWIHERNVVHRDLKPANILIVEQTAKFPLRLADFGVAYECDQPEERMVAGTLLYASPEQLSFDENSEPLDGRSDLYSLGIILYQMLTGDPPFLGETFDVFWHQILDPPLPPQDVRADLLPSLNNLILKALAKDRKDRFQSAREMSKALNAELVKEQERTEKLAELYPKALEAFVEQTWNVALERFSKIVEINPLYKDSQEKLRIAQNEVRLIELYREAVGLIEQQAWEKAMALLTEIQQLNPDYRDVAQKQAEVEQQIKLVDLYNRGKDFQLAGNWAAAQKTYVEILTIDASYKNVATELVETQRQQRLANLYNEALQFIEQKEWNSAIGNLKQVVAEEPDYDDAVHKMEYAQEQATLAEFYGQGKAYEENRDWSHALNAYQQVTRQNPDYKDAAVRLAKIQNYLDIQTNYEQGETAFAAEQWSEAVRYFEMAQAYQDSAAKLEIARRKLKIATSYTEAEYYLELGEWEPALEHLLQIAREDKEYKETSKLISYAEKQIQLNGLTSEAQKLCEDEQWSNAIDLCNRILKVDPNYPDAVRLKLDALFQKAVAAAKVEQWSVAIHDLDQLLALNPKYPKAAGLRRKAQIQQGWGSASRMRRESSSRLIVGLLMLVCTAAVMLFWGQGIISEIISLLAGGGTARQIGEIELRVNGTPVGLEASQPITVGDEVEIQVQAEDTNGELILGDAISCQWSFIPPPVPIDFGQQGECAIQYYLPPGLESQIVLEEVKAKEGAPLAGISRTSIKFILQGSE